MFSLTVIDLVRLDSDQVARNYTTHARAADRLARLAVSARIVVLVLLGTTLTAATTNLLLDGRGYRIAALATSAVTLIVYTFIAGFQFERRLHDHRVVAHRLWLVAERYRALMAEVDDGMVERAALLRRRDDLIQQLHAIYDRDAGSPAVVSQQAPAGSRHVEVGGLDAA